MAEEKNKVLLTLIKMEVLYTSLKPILLHSNSSNKHKEINDLKLSVSIESIIAKLKGNEPSHILVHGEPGCGLTTLLLGICDTLVENSWLEKFDMLSFRVRPGCSVQSLWSFLSETAETKNDTDTASLLLQSSTKLCKKNEAAQKFIASHFKLICVDDAFADGGVVWSHLSKLFHGINVSVIAVSSQTKAPVLQTILKDQSITSVKLEGVCKESYKKLLQEQLPNWKFDDDKLSRIHSVLKGNPSSLKIFVNAVKEFNLRHESFDFGFLASSVNCHDELEKHSVLYVIEFLLPQLTFLEKKVFYELCSLREPLPIVDVSEVVEKLVRLGLVRKEVIVKDTGTNNGPHALSVSSCFCRSSSQRSYIADNDGRSPDQIHKDFSVFNLWFALLSEKLRQLIENAKGNAWPFVPEKWQYISNVGEEEKYNIKELITAKNSDVPYLTEQDILEECLYHALTKEIYDPVAALVFVMDRFSYWQGSSNRTKKLVDYLKKNSPGTPIAPQLLIRKARMMKNAGNLHGAEHVLDELLIKKNQVGKWVYKEKHDYQLVRAVCFQIKGDIQFNLGHWSQGAKLLNVSLILFSTLPIPDTKGISSSLSILANCLEQMSTKDYDLLAQSYGLNTGSHPLLQAYLCSCEAAIRSQYTPLFYARHKCRAAEFMLLYAQLVHDAVQQKEFLKIAVKDFKDSIQAHKELKSLRSREEFYVFVRAVYKLGRTYQFAGTQDSIQKAGYIDEMSRLLYEHYCSCTGIILLDKEITNLISLCLSYLQLKQFCGEEDHHTRKTLINTSGNFEKSDTKGEGGTKTPYSSPLETSDLPGLQTSEAFSLADHEDILKVHFGGYPVTDKLKEMWHHTEWHDFESEVVNSILARLDKNSTDVDAQTVDRNSDRKKNVSGSVSETGNRSIVSQDLKQGASPLPSERFLTPEVSAVQSQFQGPNVRSSPRRVQGAIVWRFDFSYRQWRCQPTLAFVGDLLDLRGNKEGGERDAFMVDFIDQEDPFAKYVAKRYRKAVDLKQYQQDILCQMTARHYAMLFNQQLIKTDAQVGLIEFLPVALLRLVNSDGSLSEVYNVERYMAGEFIKFTNNLKDVWKRGTLVSDLALAFSHFTYQESRNELIIVDIQGWTLASNEMGCTFLTDPQIHSELYQCYGRGNWFQDGIDIFWTEMHPKCNHLCEKMLLTRPPQQIDKP